MRVVYEAENLIDAHLVKGLLESEDIPAFVRGEYLTGGIGELPVMGLVAVCVPEARFPEAAAVLRDWRGPEAQPEPAAGWWPEPDPA